ncbi:hypothetical protein RHSP_41163 (plasmid) [Rhizobium freirei PRF 81]|uniref:Uncharacterized protein n=1 Tax=Rhizobium freirei PRF 81 TaxID=363754 RepID=N6TTI2_9HYPH|nr:hypothetical protein RHSP_41163 [Rhizobium freirei PRF 81]
MKASRPSIGVNLQLCPGAAGLAHIPHVGGLRADQPGQPHDAVQQHLELRLPPSVQGAGDLVEIDADPAQLLGVSEHDLLQVTIEGRPQPRRLPDEAAQDLADGQVRIHAEGLERQKLSLAQPHMHDFLSGGSLCHSLLPLPLFSPGCGLATAGRASSPASGTCQFSYHGNCYPANQIITNYIVVSMAYVAIWPLLAMLADVAELDKMAHTAPCP